FFPKIENQNMPNSHTALAALENNSMREPGAQLVVEPSQNHSIHFAVHDQGLQAHMKEPNADPNQVLIHLEQAGGHMAQHLQRLQGDPTRKSEVQQKSQRLNQIAKQTDQLRQQLTEKAQSEQGQPQQGHPDPEMMRVQGDLMLKGQKQQHDMGLK